MVGMLGPKKGIKRDSDTPPPARCGDTRRKTGRLGRTMALEEHQVYVAGIVSLPRKSDAKKKVRGIGGLE